MAKLNKNLAKKVDAAEGQGDFEALDEGWYTVRLREVDTTKPDGPAGPYWVWVFEIPEGMDNAGRRFWLNTSLSEKALWKLNEVFTAFGVSADTDTDELVGHEVDVYLRVETQQQGKNKGRKINVVDQVASTDAEDNGSGEDF